MDHLLGSAVSSPLNFDLDELYGRVEEEQIMVIFAIEPKLFILCSNKAPHSMTIATMKCRGVANRPIPAFPLPLVEAALAMGLL